MIVEKMENIIRFTSTLVLLVARVLLVLLRGVRLTQL